MLKRVLILLVVYVSLVLIPAYSIANTFQWPVDSPILPLNQSYSCYNCINNKTYHVGFDLTSFLYNATDYDTPVRTIVDGFVEKIFRTIDTNSRCVHITVDC